MQLRCGIAWLGIIQIKRLGFNLIAINPNIHPDYPDDSFDEMVKPTQKRIAI